MVVEKLTAALLASLLIAGCGERVSETDARRFATDQFERTCASLNYNKNSFSGPVSTQVGGAAYAYEWKSKKPLSKFGVLVTVTSTGDTNVSLLPDPSNS